MKCISTPLVIQIALVACVLARVDTVRAEELQFDLQRRDPQTDKVTVTQEKVDSKHVGVVIVDPWNYHWCMTACARVGAMVPRWNRALQCARKLGMPVMWAPTDVASQYVGTPQRERALAVEYLDVPQTRDLSCRFTAAVGRCMCGPGIDCVVNYGWDGIHPELAIAEEDLIVSGLPEIYSLCKQRKLTHIIYMGLHTNMCLFGKPPAMKNLHAAGLQCMLCRDINDAFTHYNPDAGFTPDDGTAQTDRDLERAGIPTINMVDEMREAGVWDEDWIVETVRITPWGTGLRPYQFTDSVMVTLRTPWLENVGIRYTLDGSRPDSQSTLYEKPLRLTETTTLRTAAFRDGKPASLPGDAYFARLGAMPPEPDAYLDQLTPRKRPYGYNIWFWHPKPNQSYEGKPLRIRGRTYQQGLGMRAPANLRYELKGEYDRFVALAGVDDNMLDVNHARFLAKHASVVFKVFIDGKPVAESPVMRISQEPWRFDVKLPGGARQINLVATDAGSRSPYDLANWADAGFVLKGSRGRPPTVRVPGYWENNGRYAGYDGFAWYRCWVKAPRAWSGKDLTLTVPAVDNSHESYFNGQKVGGAGSMPPNYQNGLDSEKPCTVPAELVRPGQWNLLALRVYDAGGAGGFRDGPPVLSLGNRQIRLEGRWEFRTGDHPDWAKMPEGDVDPRVAAFEKVEP